MFVLKDGIRIFVKKIIPEINLFSIIIVNFISICLKTYLFSNTAEQMRILAGVPTSMFISVRAEDEAKIVGWMSVEFWLCTFVN